MIRDLRNSKPGPDDRADVCIVGAGAAGICLALELERLGKRVVLLEAGGRAIEETAQEPYGSEVTGHVHRGVQSGRFRALGGTTQRWGGQILELDREDFEPRPWVKGSGWPFPKSELEPFYTRALQLEGLDNALLEDGEVWRQLGLETPEFAQMEPYFTRWCPEPDFARLHGPRLEASRSVTVWLHAAAITIERQGTTVLGVRVCCRGEAGEQQQTVFRAEEYVFCLGAIECARFFLQPQEGSAPWNRSGLLGRHFQDHVDVNIATVIPRDRKRFAAAFHNVFLRGYKYHPKLRLSPAVQAETASLNCALTVTFESELDEALGELKTTAKHLLRGRWSEVGLGDAGRMARHAPLMLRQMLRLLRDHRVYNPPGSTVRLRVHCEQAPEGDSSLTLGDGRDSLGMYRTRLHWEIGPQELQTIRGVAKAATSAFSGIADVHLLPELGHDSGLCALCDDSNHHMGGMRMAASEWKGVVSPDLRVHGMNNLYVCSGAVFPSSGFSNPTHTVIALAMRLALHLARSSNEVSAAADIPARSEPVAEQVV